MHLEGGEEVVNVLISFFVDLNRILPELLFVIVKCILSTFVRFRTDGIVRKDIYRICME